MIVLQIDDTNIENIDNLIEEINKIKYFYAI